VKTGILRSPIPCVLLRVEDDRKYIMNQRLQKIIAHAGLASRRKAEEIIKAGKVKVNGQIAKIGDSADLDKDEIFVGDKKLENTQDLVYYAINKPKGYVSTVSDPHADKVVVSLVPKEPRVYPVGRLDKDSEGLMILTNDGELSQQLSHPSFKHEKEYYIAAAYLKGEPREKIIQNLKRLERGVRIGDFKTSPAVVTLKKISNLIEFNITIHEGHKRQIRQMCDKVGFSVEKLVRVREGKLELGKLKPGDFIKINKEDIT